MFQPCPHGGFCIDTSNPSDCEVNSRCVSFDSAEEKAFFDNLTDFKGEWKVSVLVNNLEVPVDVSEFFK